MSQADPYVVALIPARSGSKGVKNKNLLNLGGAPLIAWSIKCGQSVSKIQRTIVSTDSLEYAEIARNFGAEVPFIRPRSISLDASTDLEFILHALDFFKNEGRTPDYIVHLRPTTPLRDTSVVERAIAIAILNKESMSAMRSVHEMSETAYKCFEISQNGNLVTVFNRQDALDGSNLNRQSFPKTYSPNGYVDVLVPKKILSSGYLHGNNVMPFLTDKAHEIDTLDDFKYLETSLTDNRSLYSKLFGGT